MKNGRMGQTHRMHTHTSFDMTTQELRDILIIINSVTWLSLYLSIHHHSKQRSRHKMFHPSAVAIDLR